MLKSSGVFTSTCLVFLFAASQLRAGVIYTNQALFQAALSGASQAWSEDFESFPLGPSPDPLAIGGGLAEVVDGNNSTIWNNTPGGDQAWLQIGSTLANATIRGLGNTSLGIDALSFEFANQNAGNWVFNTSLGVDNSALYSPGSDQDRNFIGWIGSAGETLDSSFFNATNGIVLDNIEAFNQVAVPEPASLAVWSALASVAVLARRRRR